MGKSSPSARKNNIPNSPPTSSTQKRRRVKFIKGPTHATALTAHTYLPPHNTTKHSHPPQFILPKMSPSPTRKKKKKRSGKKRPYQPLREGSETTPSPALQHSGDEDSISFQTSGRVTGLFHEGGRRVRLDSVTGVFTVQWSKRGSVTWSLASIRVQYKVAEI